MSNPLYTIAEIERWAAEKHMSYGIYVALGLAEKEHPRHREEPEKKPKYKMTDMGSGEVILCQSMDEVADIANVCQSTVTVNLRSGKPVGMFKVERLGEKKSRAHKKPVWIIYPDGKERLCSCYREVVEVLGITKPTVAKYARSGEPMMYGIRLKEALANG